MIKALSHFVIVSTVIWSWSSAGVCNGDQLRSVKVNSYAKNMTAGELPEFAIARYGTTRMRPSYYAGIFAVSPTSNVVATFLGNNQSVEGYQRGQASLFKSCGCGCLRCRPRERIVDFKLRRPAVDFTHASSPSGRPR